MKTIGKWLVMMTLVAGVIYLLTPCDCSRLAIGDKACPGSCGNRPAKVPDMHSTMGQTALAVAVAQVPVAFSTVVLHQLRPSDLLRPLTVFAHPDVSGRSASPPVLRI